MTQKRRHGVACGGSFQFHDSIMKHRPFDVPNSMAFYFGMEAGWNTVTACILTTFLVVILPIAGATTTEQ
jgi:hypothetical protein